jgi:hypothetical protein
MSLAPRVRGRVVLLCAILGAITVEIGSSGCDVDIPACPGQCFAYTVEYDLPRQCQTIGGNIDIPFTAPSGYHGRHCFNSPSVPLVMDAIDHLRAGGQLSDLALDVQTAYISTVDSVRADIQAECNTAAPGQCLDADQVCTGIAADAYEQLVVDETCILALDGIERVTLGPGEVCEASVNEQGTGSVDTGDHCIETTIGTGDSGLDETAGSGVVDGTSG